MHIENKRLLAAIQEAVDGLAAIGDTPQARTFQAAATTAICELLRREDRQIEVDYAQGFGCGKALLHAMKAAGKTSTDGARQLAALPSRADAAMDIEARYALLEQLRQALARMIAEANYPVGNGCAIDEAVLAIFGWEAGVCKLPAPAQGAKHDAVDIQSVLEQSTRSRGGVFRNARVTKCLPLHGGFGKNTTLFEMEDDESRTWRMVSRATQNINLLDLPGQDIGKEFHLVSYAFRHGIRVAEPLWLENDKQTHGVRFFVSRQVSGRNYGSAVAAEPLTPAQVKSLATELAAIHRLPLDSTDADLRRSPIDTASGSRPLTDVVREYVRSWADFWRTLEVGAYPAMEAALSWLQANLPEVEDEPVLLHGDYALHNILIEGDEIGGVLDWEMSHVGDRAEDISWLLSTIGQHVGQEAFMHHYREAGGRAVSQFQLKYYQVLVHVKLLLVTIEAQLRIQQLPHAGPHYCTLGLGFIQHPSSCLEGAIRVAEAARD